MMLRFTTRILKTPAAPVMQHLGLIAVGTVCCKPPAYITKDQAVSLSRQLT